jgi:hypothetical protein
LILFAYLHSKRNGKQALIGLALLSVFCLRLTDAKQGYVDLLITTALIVSALIYKRFPRRQDRDQFSIPVRTTILTFALFLWLEFIFVVPFVGKAIPFVGDDPQVAIRGVLWLAGLNQFKAFPALGVGPDQYGAYYEHYRTVNSTIILPGDSSNDAHSATVQTLATTGVIGSLIFILLIAYVIRSILILLESGKISKPAIYSLALYLFIFLTNAAISPIVLPHKFLFWAVSGYLIFEAHRSTEHESQRITPQRVFIPVLAVLVSLSLTVGTAFAVGQFNFIRWGEAHKKDISTVQQVSASPFIPCQTYFNYLNRFISPSGDLALEKLSRRQVEINPRCQEAQRILAILAYNRGDLKEMRERVYILIDLAPAQREVLDLATAYAIKGNDEELEKIVTEQLARMGVKRIQIE